MFEGKSHEKMFFYEDQQLQKQNLMYTTPISNMYQVSPPTLINHNGFDDLLLAPHLRLTTSRTTPTPSPPPLSDAPTKELDVAVTSTRVATTRKRATRKDRHSKIVTAQGIRDRRMRLSVDVSKKFFELQDMLGFDKGSKTVDWLLTKSSKAIKVVSLLHSTPKLRRCCSGIGKSESSVSECEVNSTNNAGNILFNDSTSFEEEGKTPKEALTTNRNLLIMKDSKRKARENRFKEKEVFRRSSSTTNIEDVGDQSKQIVSSTTPLETTCEESETAYDMKSSTAVVGTNEYGVEFGANSSSLNLLQENWSMQCCFLGGGGQEVNFGDYPFYERYWDELNSLGIL